MPVYDYITNTGLITVDTSVISDEVIAEYKNLFGADLVTTPNTPQGMLITAEILARVAVAENNAKLANQINPNLAGGIFLDSIMALTNPFGRVPASPTIVFATLAGTPGTVIPAGSVVSETGSGDANQFATVDIVTIPGSGFINSVRFNSIENGPIPCNAGTLTVIVTPILGWDTVSNSTAPILGNLTQSDVAARTYRLNTLATQGASVAQAIISGITQVPGTKSLFFQENFNSTSQTINGVSMVRNSIYACVDGTGIGTSSTVTGTITGTPATVVPSGSQASSNGYVFETLESVTIPGGGSIDTTFQALMTGPIPVPIGTLTTIVTPVGGWASVINAADAILGLSSGIAQAMVAKKSAGAAFNNGSGVPIQTVVSVPYSGQLMTVLFDNPNPIQINVVVNVSIVNSVQNITELVQTAITDYANGLIPGVAGLTVGKNVSSFELAGAVTRENPAIYVQSLYIALNPTNPTSSAEIPIAVYEIAVIETANIIVNVLSI